MKRFDIKKIAIGLVIAGQLAFHSTAVLAGGGMYPINQLSKAKLKKKGLKISEKKVYDPNGGPCLLQGVVQVGGCTGSFISKEGMILTNHHCAMSTLQPYSSLDNNLLEKGYLAADRSKELKTNLVVKIMVNHQDVSAEIVSVKKGMNSKEDRKRIEEKIKSIRDADQAKNPNLVVEISEMMPNKSYLLMRYKVLRDIRVVYIPARNIGEFGGESDNWVWPRHNADFSLLRAYDDSEGKGSSYAVSNTPFVPQQSFVINAKGLKENDFVMVWGYPGRTFRHYPSGFVNLHLDQQLPYISAFYDWKIRAIHDLGDPRTGNAQWGLSQTSYVKRLSNTMKNYKGKIKSLQGLDQVQVLKDEEAQLIAKLGGASSSYSSTLSAANSKYDEMRGYWKRYLWTNEIFGESSLAKIMQAMLNYKELESLITERINNKDGNTPLLKKMLDSAQTATYNVVRNLSRGVYITYDSLVLKKMIRDGMAFGDGQNILTGSLIPAPLQGIKRTKQWIDPYKLDQLSYSEALRISIEGFDQTYKEYFEKTQWYDTLVLRELLAKPDKIDVGNDWMLKWMSILMNEGSQMSQKNYALQLELNNLLVELTDEKLAANKSDFIPDANSTLRLTYGNIKGYYPLDAVHYEPTSTIEGMFAKEKLGPDFVVNDNLRVAYQKGKKGKYSTKSGKGQQVCVLYNTDTSGGNSGSPVMNEYGELVGLNFDRAFEATVNDYAWDDKYSRSIGVDIRFVLWVVDEVADAQHILKELNVKN